jgi:hypothetical protein
MQYRGQSTACPFKNVFVAVQLMRQRVCLYWGTLIAAETCVGLIEQKYENKKCIRWFKN